MSNRRAGLPSLAIALTLLAGCGEMPSSARLVSKAAVAPVSAPAATVTAPAAPATAPTREVVLSPSAGVKRVDLSAAPAEASVEADAEEPTLSAADLVGAVPTEPVADVVAYSSVRTDAEGVAIASIEDGYYGDPVYLSPPSYLLLLPGTAAPLPAFTPKQVDTSAMPTDAFVELGRLKRLREAKKTRLSWLFGNTFPAISTGEARTRLAAGTPIYLGPDGSRWHRDKTFKQITDPATIDAMLPELREDALGAAARAVRYQNIQGRQAVLPPFNRTYDVMKLALLDLITSDYRYGGQGVRRGMVAAANYYELASVKNEIATWWEDHPHATVGELRLATNGVLSRKFQDLYRRVDWMAANPNGYSEARLIPGLRDPRPKTENNSFAYDADVRYNRDVLLQVTTTTPAILGSALFP